MLKSRIYPIFIIFMLFFSIFNAYCTEIFEKDGIFVDIPSQMIEVKSDIPLVITQFKFKNKDFPTITITKDESATSLNNKLPQEIEQNLKNTYEDLGFKVTSANYLKNQDISTFQSKLFQIEYSYSGILYVSLVNIFAYKNNVHYITTINKLDNKTPLTMTQALQENFIKNISLENEAMKNKESKNNADNATANVLLAGVMALIIALVYGSKKVKKS